MSKFFIVLLVIFILLSGFGITGTIIYFERYTNSQRIISIYIDECGKLRTGFEDARQLIFELGKRNRSIAEAARKGFELIQRKFDIKN